jgi:hypothetical protein
MRAAGRIRNLKDEMLTESSGNDYVEREDKTLNESTGNEGVYQYLLWCLNHQNSVMVGKYPGVAETYRCSCGGKILLRRHGEPVTHPAVLMRRRQLNTAVESPTRLLRFEPHVFPSGAVNVVDNYLSGLFIKTEAEEKANTW